MWEVSGGEVRSLRLTSRKRLRSKLSEVKAELRRRRHGPVPEVGKWLRAVVQGHINYYDVPLNTTALYTFVFHVVRRWRRALQRRGRKGRMMMVRMRSLVERGLLASASCTPIRRSGWASGPKAGAELCELGSARRAPGNRRPYHKPRNPRPQRALANLLTSWYAR